MTKLAMIGWMAIGLSVATFDQANAATHAAKVVALQSGDGAAPGFGDPSAALGEPSRFTGVGAFPGVVSAFNPPYMPGELVSIGEGGFVTLQLSNFLLTDAAQLDLGVFTNVGFIDNDFPNGRASDPLSAEAGTFGADAATLEVSADGVTWVPVGETLFDLPTVGYSDVTNPFAGEAGTVPSDFGKPYAGTLADLAGLNYANPAGADILETLDGSGGGTWLNLSDAGLDQIGWLRFSVADDGDAETHNKFELDGVSLNNASVGPAVPEPSTLALASLLALLTWSRQRQRPE